jgi:hypothetical protein
MQLDQAAAYFSTALKNCGLGRKLPEAPNRPRLLVFETGKLEHRHILFGANLILPNFRMFAISKKDSENSVRFERGDRGFMVGTQFRREISLRKALLVGKIRSSQDAYTWIKFLWGPLQVSANWIPCVLATRLPIDTSICNAPVCQRTSTLRTALS